MAPPKKKDVQAKQSAEAVKASDQAEKVATDTVLAQNAEMKGDGPKREDMLYTFDGQPVNDEADQPYTIDRLTEIEKRLADQAMPTDNSEVDKLNGQINAYKEANDKLIEANAGLESNLSMWKQRAEDAENRIAWLKEQTPRDSMGYPKTIKE